MQSNGVFTRGKERIEQNSNSELKMKNQICHIYSSFSELAWSAPLPSLPQLPAVGGLTSKTDVLEVQHLTVLDLELPLCLLHLTKTLQLKADVVMAELIKQAL